ncbi:MAG: ISAs1 family transposase [Chloroflexota bacterium]|nr:ISAs1 family transposase [Chloroflexota bacterium]
MESTPACPDLSVSPESLLAALSEVADARRAASVVYPLGAMLALAVAAFAAGQTSVLAIARWAARQEAATLEILGLPPGRVPCQSTLHRLFRHLDVASLTAQVQAAFAPVTAPPAPGPQGIALDGKGQRGRGRYSGRDYAVHAVTAVCHATGLVVAHEPITDHAGSTDTELPAARRLLRRLDWAGRVVTGDRLYGQPWLCAAVLAAGGDYLLLVGGNQSRRYRALTTLLTDPSALPDARTVETVEDGHGRVDERRVLSVTAAVAPLGDDWPGIQQAFRLTRTWTERGVAHTSVRYGITSLRPDQASPAQLLQVRRGHWTIENRVHRQKDGLLREDASQVHCGSGPAVLSVLRDAALNLLYLHDIRTVLAHTQYLAQFPHHALALVCQPLTTHA